MELEKKKWKYKITSGYTGVVLSFLLLLGFGGLAYWFHITQNGAIIIGRVIVVFATIAFALALYRALFFKVLIEKEGFFFQTAPGNGRYFYYYEIKRMWISSGRETNSNEAIYCNFETNGGQIFRFFITGADTDAANYLIKRVNATETLDGNQLKDDNCQHVISGKVQGLQRIAVVLFIFAIIIYMTKSLADLGLSDITYILPMILAPISIAWVVVNYFFFKIIIEKEGFYCRTNPFNGRYFKYSDIRDCKVIEERRKYGSAYGAGVRETRYFYFLLFTDANNKKHKILYNKALFEQEMNLLVHRAKQAQGKGMIEDEK